MPIVAKSAPLQAVLPPFVGWQISCRLPAEPDIPRRGRLEITVLDMLRNSLVSIRRQRKLGTWGIPAVYAFIALSAGLAMPRIEGYVHVRAAPISIGSATAIYSSIASGMIALTGIVFSLVFLMVQFSATAYSPRLVLWIARAPVVSHALGVFIATFLFAISALSGVDRNGSGRVPIFSTWVVVALLVASVAMFIALVEQISALQIGRMLIFAADRGREAMAATYPPVEREPRPLHGPTSALCLASRRLFITESLGPFRP